LKRTWEKATLKCFYVDENENNTIQLIYLTVKSAVHIHRAGRADSWWLWPDRKYLIKLPTETRFVSLLEFLGLATKLYIFWLSLGTIIHFSYLWPDISDISRSKAWIPLGEDCQFSIRYGKAEKTKTDLFFLTWMICVTFSRNNTYQSK